MFDACTHTLPFLLVHLNLKLRCYLFLVVSELQEEGINAINLPLSPSHYELDPEDTMLGKTTHRSCCTQSDTFSKGAM